VSSQPDRGDPSAFWTWFAANRHRFDTPGERPPEPVLDEVLERLRRYQGGLGFEIFNDDERDDRRFIVTAYGERDLFAAVDALVEAAPDDLGWRVIAVKLEKGFDFVHERDGRDYDPKTMTFDPLRAGGDARRLGVRVYLPDYRREDEEAQFAAVEVVLLTILGERRFAESIHAITVAPWPDGAVSGEPLRLDELPAYVDWHRRRFGLGA